MYFLFCIWNMFDVPNVCLALCSRWDVILYPCAPCIEYLPTFANVGIFIPYMEHLGYIARFCDHVGSLHTTLFAHQSAANFCNPLELRSFWTRKMKRCGAVMAPLKRIIAAMGQLWSWHGVANFGTPKDITRFSLGWFCGGQNHPCSVWDLDHS